MKILPSVKLVGVALLTLGMVVGCATGPKPSEQPQVQDQASAAQAAIAEAKAAIAKAKGLGYEWNNTDQMLKEAEEAAAQGSNEKAIQLANQARDQAELAIKQAQDEQGMDRGLRGQAPSSTASGSYKVMKGDSLWKISAKPETYGNPYQWPLIYKANSGQIKDPDLIYPGQDFSIDTGATQAEVDAAVRHAKTRGAWKIGVAEQADKDYLAGTR